MRLRRVICRTFLRCRIVHRFGTDLRRGSRNTPIGCPRSPVWRGTSSGDYSFTHEIQIGDRLVFEDMAIYSMVKNNTFNGIPLPSIAMLREDGEVEMLKQFGYEDFKGRLS